MNVDNIDSYHDYRVKRLVVTGFIGLSNTAALGVKSRGWGGEGRLATGG